MLRRSCLILSFPQSCDEVTIVTSILQKRKHTNREVNMHTARQVANQDSILGLSHLKACVFLTTKQNHGENSVRDDTSFSFVTQTRGISYTVIYIIT